jgi:Holliday junction resolvase
MVEAHLQENEELRHYSYRDERLPCAPTNRRPDFVWILADHVVIVEVDESCHRHYLRSCEIARILELHESLGGKPMILIRFNPLQKWLEGLTTSVRYHLHRETKTLKTAVEVVFIGYPEHLQYDFASEVAELQHNQAIQQEVEDANKIDEEEDDKQRRDSDNDQDFWF